MVIQYCEDGQNFRGFSTNERKVCCVMIPSFRLETIGQTLPLCPVRNFFGNSIAKRPYNETRYILHERKRMNNISDCKLHHADR